MSRGIIDNPEHVALPVEVVGPSDQFAQVLIDRMGAVSEGNGFERHGRVPYGAGIGTVRKLDLRDGMSVEIFDQYFHEEPSSRFHLTYPALRLVFFLFGTGHLTAFSPWGIRKTVVDQSVRGCCSMAYFPELRGGFRIKKKTRYVQVTVNIAPHILRNILQDHLEGLPRDLHAIAEGADDVGYYHIAPISDPISWTLHELLFCPYGGAVRKMFIESKAMELVAHKLAQLPSVSKNTKMANIVGSDLERIYQAEALLCRDLENPPVLGDLALSVGLSPRKLNDGFRRIFGSTVFGYLRRVRLERARYLLEKRGWNVTEAALAVGYNSLPSFSRAFSDHFRMPPKRFARS